MAFGVSVGGVSVCVVCSSTYIGLYDSERKRFAETVNRFCVIVIFKVLVKR